MRRFAAAYSMRRFAAVNSAEESLAEAQHFVAVVAVVVEGSAWGSVAFVHFAFEGEFVVAVDVVAADVAATFAIVVKRRSIGVLAAEQVGPAACSVAMWHSFAADFASDYCARWEGSVVKLAGL